MSAAVFAGTTILGAIAALIGVNLFFDRLTMLQVMGIFYPTVIACAAAAGVANHLMLGERISLRAIAVMNALQHLAAAFLAWAFILLGVATGSAGAGRLSLLYVGVAPWAYAALSWFALTTWARRRGAGAAKGVAR